MKREKTRVTKSRLKVVLHLIDWESTAKFPDNNNGAWSLESMIISITGIECRRIGLKVLFFLFLFLFLQQRLSQKVFNSNNDINTLTSFSESPRHLLTMDEADMLKNVVLHSVATALARRVFPVPYKDENINK